MKEFIFFLPLNTSHIYIQSIGSEKMFTSSSSEISFKKMRKIDCLIFFLFLLVTTMLRHGGEFLLFLCAYQMILLNYLFLP